MMSRFTIQWHPSLLCSSESGAGIYAPTGRYLSIDVDSHIPERMDVHASCLHPSSSMRLAVDVDEN
jgi:hypothetical protein